MVTRNTDIHQFDVLLVALDPTMGHEIKKTRPCLVISPDEMNKFLGTILVAPMTTTVRSYPFRVKVTFGGKKGDIALDQMRSIDCARVVKCIGRISTATSDKVKATLQEIFA